MKESEQSSTALGAAVIRAVHQLIDDDPRILEDPVSVRLLTSECIAQIQTDQRRYRTPQAKVLRSHLVLRSRFAEDELCEAARSGIRQFLR
jgi:O-methyltransferase involved in polyketide biosynthesis